MDIIYLFKVLVRRRWTILSCLAFGLAAGLLAYIISPTQYISTAQYYTGFAETRPVSLQSNDVYEASQTEFRVNNVIETFKSPLIVTMVSYELLLHDLESSSPFRILSGREKQKASFSKADNAKVRQILHDKLKSLKILSADEYWEKLVLDILRLYDYDEESIQKKLVVDRIPKTGYFNVSFSSEKPELSAFVVNQIGVKCRDLFNSLSYIVLNTKLPPAIPDSLGETRHRADTLRNSDFNVRQIMPGQPPVRPVPGNALKMLAISGLTMFFLSILIIIVLEMLDNTLRTPSIFKKETRLKVMAGIGQVDLDKKQLSDYFRFTPGSEREQNHFPFIENLRKLRYEIERSGKKIILFTSTGTQAGKTTIIEALAHTFSLSRRKVLLIDANFSNNNLTRDFSASQALNHFDANRPADSGIRSVISQTPIPCVQVVGCEEGNFTPSEIPAGNNFLRHLGELKSDYDFVFIEGPALNTHADSKELSDFTDGIMLIFSAKNSLGDIDRESIAFLRTCRQQLLGAVLNKIDEQNLDL